MRVRMAQSGAGVACCSPDFASAPSGLQHAVTCGNRKAMRHDQRTPAIRQRQLFRNLPGGLDGDGRGQPRPRAGLWRRPLDRQGVGCLSRAVRDRLRGVLRLQRHGGQFAGAGVALPVLPQRDLLRRGACRDRRVRRAGVLFQRLEAAGGAVGRRQADAGGDPRHRDRPQRHPFSQAPRGDGHAADRDRTGLWPRRVAGDLGGVPRTGPQPAHGRRAFRQCLRQPRAAARPT